MTFEIGTFATILTPFITKPHVYLIIEFKKATIIKKKKETHANY